jgi:hypothetical protein
MNLDAEALGPILEEPPDREPPHEVDPDPPPFSVRLVRAVRILLSQPPRPQP